MLLARLGLASAILHYARVAVSEVQRLSSFDGAMAYQFDAEWNGEVIAEAGQVPEPGAQPAWPEYVSYLGEHFP